MLRRGSALAPAAVLAGALAPAAHASPASPRTAVVSMGDSYISGEAGRWAGNSLDAPPGNARTDRACLPFGSTSCAVGLQHVYLGISATDGCHRSDVAEIRSTRIRVTRRINIACSGAETGNLLPTSAGGVPDRGEPGQLQELFHPNAYAQRALGRCLVRVYAHTPGRFSCSGDAGLRPRQVRFTQTETFPLPRLRLRARRVVRASRPRATCERLVVRSAGRPVAQARVSFAGRLRHTNARGAAVVCARLGAGRYAARAAKRNYRGARVAVRLRA